MMEKSTAVSLSAWLVINVILASASRYVTDVTQLMGLDAYGLYVFFALVLLLIVLNIAFLLRAKTILLRGLFAIAILWIGFFSIMIGSVDAFTILFNLDFLLRSFVTLL